MAPSLNDNPGGTNRIEALNVRSKGRLALSLASLKPVAALASIFEREHIAFRSCRMHQKAHSLDCSVPGTGRRLSSPVADLELVAAGSLEKDGVIGGGCTWDRGALRLDAGTLTRQLSGQSATPCRSVRIGRGGVPNPGREQGLFARKGAPPGPFDPAAPAGVAFPPQWL